MPNFSAIIASPLGNIGIGTIQDKLCALKFLDSSNSRKKSNDSITRHVIEELEAYFENSEHVFTVPLLYQGTPFQQSTWRALQKITPGATLTYGGLAKKLKTGPRAIGQACRTNRIPIIIPCHRIISTSDVGGFAGKQSGSMLAIKRWLLKHERAAI